MASAYEWQMGTRPNQIGGQRTKAKRQQLSPVQPAQDGVLCSAAKPLAAFLRKAGVVDDNDLAWTWDENELRVALTQEGVSDVDTRQALSLWTAARSQSLVAMQSVGTSSSVTRPQTVKRPEAQNDNAASQQRAMKKVRTVHLHGR